MEPVIIEGIGDRKSPVWRRVVCVCVCRRGTGGYEWEEGFAERKREGKSPGKGGWHGAVSSKKGDLKSISWPRRITLARVKYNVKQELKASLGPAIDVPRALLLMKQINNLL